MPKPSVPPKCVNGKDMADNSENEVSFLWCVVWNIAVDVVIFISVVWCGVVFFMLSARTFVCGNRLRTCSLYVHNYLPKYRKLWVTVAS